VCTRRRTCRSPEVPNPSGNVHCQEEIGSERSGDLEYFHRENGNLHEVVKGRVNLDRQIQKGTLRRSMYFGEVVLQKKGESRAERLPKSRV